MRSDYKEEQKFTGRTQSEADDDASICGINALKLIRAVNVFVAISICVCCSLRIYTMFDRNSGNS